MTLFNNLPLVMVMAFLLITLVVGLYYSRKVTTLREYAIGNKQFPTATLVATMLATSFGGAGLLRNVESTHAKGLFWILVINFSPIGFWLLAPLMLRMGPFMQHLSLAESIGNIYGNLPRLVAALVSIIRNAIVVAMQIIAITKAIEICINLSATNNTKLIQNNITVITTCILIMYSMFGGIRSVTFTDVLQFITFTAIIPLIAWFIFRTNNQSMAEVASILYKEPKFQLNSCLHISKLLALLGLFLTSIVLYIEPTTVQRIYMASSPIQARKLLIYSGIFTFIIDGFIVLIALFLFVKAPTLPMNQIWPYIFENIPTILKGFIAISLLAMAMSTADSMLNVCSVMVSHDIIGNVKTVKITDKYKLTLARLTTLIVGIGAMLLAFWKKDLLSLLMFALDFSVPIVTAPFLLAVYGFRSSSRTALIGMATGVVAILAWKQWIESITGIDGAFPSMLANGLAMLLAHYLLPQPAGSGWVAPDKIYQQRQQEKARIKRRNKQERKNFFLKKKLAKFKPSRAGLLLTGIYLIVIGATSFGHCYDDSGQSIYSYDLLLLSCIGLFYMGYAVYGYPIIPDWVVGSCWFFSLLIALPLHMLISCCLVQDFLLSFILFFTHGAVLLWALPLYWSLRGLFVTAVAVLVMYCFKTTILWPAPMVLFSLLVAGVCFLTLVVYLKQQNSIQQECADYLRKQQAYKEAYALKKLAYSEELPTASPQNALAQEGTILEKAIQHVTQSIAFVNSTTPFLKEDFQSIIDKFAEWAYYFRSRAKRQDQLLLQPKVIPLEALIDAGEVAYQKEKGYLPGLWVEEVVNIPDTMLGDREQLVRLLFLALNHVRQSSASFRSPITLQLQLT
ncbi:MAG: sodium:solute symporter family protein, partial [Candidatus Cardinium sp.]|nr:sodium:solute symporter family protein [Candidatus Cardinium sp.]